MKMDKVFAHALNAAVLASLVIGNDDAKTFAFWMVSVISAVMMLGALALNREGAEKLSKRPAIERALSATVSVAYVVALIYAGFPILAAIYAFVALFLRAAISVKMDKQVEK